MTLPVVLLGGAAWWFGSGGKTPQVNLSNPFDPGPLRVEYTPFQVVEPLPYDVSQGYSWAAKTQMQVVGKWTAPAGWKQKWESDATNPNLWLVYRKGKNWKAPSLLANQPLVNLLRSSTLETSVFGVNLQTVPRDADEVHLRGKFQREVWFSGPIPRGWIKPKNMRIIGTMRGLMLESKPFDLQIKGPNEPFPRPIVSRQSPLQLVAAKWIADPDRQTNQFLLRLRRGDGLDWKAHPPIFLQKQLWESDGQLIKAKGLDTSESFSDFDRDLFHPRLPDSDVVVAFVAPLEFEAERAFGQVKAPITLHAQITDGECWPLSVDVRVPRVEMKLSDFGAPK